MSGSPLQVDVEVDGLGVIRETIWFSKSLTFSVLGQSSWFEQVGAVFRNFPASKHGRTFHLFLRG